MPCTYPMPGLSWQRELALCHGVPAVSVDLCWLLLRARRNLGVNKEDALDHLPVQLVRHRAVQLERARSQRTSRATLSRGRARLVRAEPARTGNGGGGAFLLVVASRCTRRTRLKGRVPARASAWRFALLTRDWKKLSDGMVRRTSRSICLSTSVSLK